MTEQNQNQVALIMGGSRGIGAATALALADNGYSVCVSYRKSREKADAIVEKIAAKGGSAIAAKVDLADAASIRNAIDTVINNFGGLDLLVNNASMIFHKPFDQITQGEVDEVVTANVSGVFIATQYAGQSMRTGGSVISIGTSMVNRSPMEGGSLYVTTKAAISGLTKGFAYEFATRNLRINAIHPGSTVSDLNPEDGPLAESQKQMMLMRSFGQPVDIARAVAFLASDAASRITGAELVVDGGWSV